MIHLHNVTKTYGLDGGGRRRVLDRVTLSLPHRNIGILGRNGAGKSTLLRMISGLVDPDEGRIVRDVSVSWPIGFRGSFHGYLTGLENVRFVARLYGADEDEVIRRVTDFAELGPFLKQPVRTYSSGMSARLAFGLSLALQFDTYLVDELLSVGDANFRAKSRSAFDRLLQKSRIIMASHSMNALSEYCDCALLIDGGRATFFDDLPEAIDHYHRINGLSPKQARRQRIQDWNDE
jgi:capsular polysaccharide transport system ATP-binding protein